MGTQVAELMQQETQTQDMKVEIKNGRHPGAQAITKMYSRV